MLFRRDHSARGARWRLLEGRPFGHRPRVAVLVPAPPEDPARLEELRRIAAEFDLLLFAFTEKLDANYPTLLQFCSRLILVEDPRRVERSGLMKTLWEGFSRELTADVRQVEGPALAGYGGDLLVGAPPENGFGWGPWLRRRTLARFRRVLRNGEGDPGMRAQIYRELMGTVEIRKATEADVAALDRIQHLSSGAVIWDPHSYLGYDCRVAEQAGRVVGFVVCRVIPSGESEVLSLVVDPQARRRGIGRQLMDVALSLSHGPWYLEVRESNWPARKLYQKLGFVDVATRPNYYQDSGETAVVMRLESC